MKEFDVIYISFLYIPFDIKTLNVRVIKRNIALINTKYQYTI